MSSDVEIGKWCRHGAASLAVKQKGLTGEEATFVWKKVTLRRVKKGSPLRGPVYQNGHLLLPCGARDLIGGHADGGASMRSTQDLGTSVLLVFGGGLNEFHRVLLDHEFNFGVGKEPKALANLGGDRPDLSE